MKRHDYYEKMKELARSVRSQHGLTGPRVTLTDLRGVYNAYGIKIDLRKGLKKLRGAYFDDEYGTSVLISKDLPEDPRVFTMGHELKHHLVDRNSSELNLKFGIVSTDSTEIGAEIFSAELLFPEAVFDEMLSENGVTKGACRAEHLVRLKHDTRTTLSYQGLVKRAVFLGFADPSAFSGVKFKKLEEEMYGKPFRRQRKRATVG